MAMKKQDVKIVKKQVDIAQKIVVAQGRAMGEPQIPYKTLYTERVKSKEAAIKRVAELKEEYKDTDGLSVCYFSI